MNLLRDRLNKDVAKTKQQIANEKRQATRKKNAAAKRKEAREAFYAKRREENKARIARNKAEAAKKQSARAESLLTKSKLNKSDEVAKIGMKDALQDSVLDRNASDTNNPKLYKKLVKERAKDVTTASEARSFVNEIKNPDAFMIKMKTIPKYAKIIKNYSQDNMFQEAKNKFQSITKERSSSYKAPELFRDGNGRTMEENMDYVESDAFGKKTNQEKQEFINSLAASILSVPSNDHSMAAAVAIAAEGGWDDSRITGHNGIRHGHNFKKNKRGRSVGTEQAIDFANMVGNMSGVDANEALKYAYESNK